MVLIILLLGQRTIKSVSGDNNYYLYDEAGNLAGEYDNSGSTVSEHIYLNGVPVGLVKANVLYNVHTDQIGTPRVITNSSNVIVWKWDNTDPYGGNLPSVNTIVYNKRFSGQYFDNESKLHYNYYRSYNPLVGRYIQSDPLGLAAGFNTYNYVEGNPFGASDRLGLDGEGFYDYKHRFSWSNLTTSNMFSLPALQISNLTFMPIEEAIKNLRPNDPSVMRFGGHGSTSTFNGSNAEDFSKQIISGNIKNLNGIVKRNDWARRIAQNQDITIIIGACDTGIVNSAGNSFAGNVLKYLVAEAKSKPYSGKITIYAPNGLTNFIWFYGEYVVKDKEIIYDSEPKNFGYLKFQAQFPYK